MNNFRHLGISIFSVAAFFAGAIASAQTNRPNPPENSDRSHGTFSPLTGQISTNTVALAGGEVAPFSLEGNITQRTFRRGVVNTPDEEAANITLYYSNGWWRAQLAYLSPLRVKEDIDDCMTVPGGLRNFTIFKAGIGAGRAYAEVCPLAFPPPGRPMMFAVWLSLCPNPQLPLIDGRRMHRFVHVPDCEVEILNVPENEGTYALSYLEPGKAFLSRLNITNNGFSVDMNVGASGGLENTISRYGPPFDDGFLEMNYEVTAKTNFNGVAFPLRSVLRFLSPNYPAKNRGDSGVRTEIQINITRTSAFSSSSAAAHNVKPAGIFAYDFRSTNGMCAVYAVSNDQWQAASSVDSYLWQKRKR